MPEVNYVIYYIFKITTKIIEIVYTFDDNHTLPFSFNIFVYWCQNNVLKVMFDEWQMEGRPSNTMMNITYYW